MNTNRIDKPVRITSEGLNLLTSMDFRKIHEMNGFYGKEVFLSDEFAGDINYLLAALGCIGAHPRQQKLNKEDSRLDLKLDSDIALVVISDKIIKSHNADNIHPFVAELEAKLNSIELEDDVNKDNSKQEKKVFSYRRMFFITEDHLLFYLNRIATGREKEDPLKNLIREYKKSVKQQTNSELNLF